MCMNCVSTAEAAVGQAVFVGYAVREPVLRALARVGLADEPDPVARDARTVAFLRELELDPVQILGADAVATADAWSPAPRQARRFRSRRLSSARPIGSHSFATAT